jgi:hypothetical protein
MEAMETPTMPPPSTMTSASSRAGMDDLRRSRDGAISRHEALIHHMSSLTQYLMKILWFFFI